MKKSTLVTYFDQTEITKLYQLLLEYSIRNYTKKKKDYEKWNLLHDSADQKEFININWKILTINNAMELKTQKIEISDQELEEILLEAKSRYYQNIEDNKPVIDLYFRKILIILAKNMPKTMTEEEKLEYIFDFVTNYVNYSEQYHKYCTSIPLINGIEFDFKDQTPVDKNVKGTLVQGQGVCEEICNLIQYLGRAFNIPVGKTFVTNKGQLHVINTYEKEEIISLIDATIAIRENISKDECFLVSEKLLNKNKNYVFQEILQTKTIQKSKNQSLYNIRDIINEVKSSLPKVIHTSYTQKRKKYTIN